MTPTNIPPCPVCGTAPHEMPTKEYCNGVLLICGCGITCDSDDWIDHCMQSLYSALSERGIHTIAELESRLSDQRAAVLSDAPCSKCGYNGPGYYQPDTHPCAAQRGEE